jgi:hypothetical protein
MARLSGPQIPADRSAAFRRIPGTRRYYTEDRGVRTEVTEHYAIRVYPKTLNAEQRAEQKVNQRRAAAQERASKAVVMNKYQIKTGRSKKSINSDPEFKKNYAKLQQLRYNDHNVLLSDDINSQDKSANGEYAQTLVELGLRSPEDTHDVGDSPINQAEVTESYWKNLLAGITDAVQAVADAIGEI